MRIYIQGAKKTLKKLESWEKYPSPKWISYHGIKAYLDKSKSPLKDRTQWKTIRENIIQHKKGSLEQVEKANEERDKRDVVSFVAQGEQVFTNFNGLKDTVRLQKLLANQDYVTVLKYLWSEPDHNKRLKWLLEEAQEGHVILMCELAKEYAYFKDYDNAFMWTLIDVERAVQDASCCLDPSVMEAPTVLQKIHKKYLNMHDIRNFLKVPIDTWKREIVTKALKHLRAWKNYPSPAWISSYGTAYLQLKRDSDTLLKPENEWKAIRDQVLNDFAQTNNL